MRFKEFLLEATELGRYRLTVPKFNHMGRMFYDDEVLHVTQIVDNTVHFYIPGLGRYSMDEESFDSVAIPEKEYNRRFLDSLHNDDLMESAEERVVLKQFSMPGVYISDGTPSMLRMFWVGMPVTILREDDDFVYFGSEYMEFKLPRADFYDRTCTKKEYDRKFLNDLHDDDLTESVKEDPVELVTLMTNGYVQNGLKRDIEVVNVRSKSMKNAAPKACFNNSFKYLLHNVGDIDGGKYVLGFVLVHGIPVEHAWVKENGQYFDVTLSHDPEKIYVKVAEYDFKEVMKVVNKIKTGPTIYDMTRQGKK